METNNETIDDIIREMREDWAMTYFCEGTKKKNGEYSNIAAIGSQTVAERIEAAHKREMAHNESLLQRAGATIVELMNTMSAKHEEIKKLRGLVVLVTSALERATVMRCIMADSGIPCKDLLDDDSCGAENCKSMCGRWRELIDKAKKEVAK